MIRANVGWIFMSALACGNSGPRMPGADAGLDPSLGDPVQRFCAAKYVDDVSRCTHGATDYEPRKNGSRDDAWSSCAADDYYSNQTFPLVVGPSAPQGGVGRVRAAEEMGLKLWRNSKVPTRRDFEDALVIFGSGDGSISSRMVRRQDIHYPELPNNSKTKCTEPGVAEGNPDRCVGPARLVPMVNGAFEAALNHGEQPLVQAARIEAALLWFAYVSLLAEQGSCRDTREDCDSTWSHYNAAQSVDSAAQAGLGEYIKSLSEETHRRSFDGLLAISCWRHIDSGVMAMDTSLYERAQGQIDAALLRGLALVLRDRLNHFACSTGEVQKAHLAFINSLGPFLDRAARAKDSAEADLLKAEVNAVSPSEVDVMKAIAALDALFPCP